MFEFLLILAGMALREDPDPRNVGLGNIFVSMGVGALIITSRHAVVVVKGTDDWGLVSKELLHLPEGTSVTHVTPLR